MLIVSAIYYRRIVNTCRITAVHIVVEDGAIRSCNHDEDQILCL